MPVKIVTKAQTKKQVDVVGGASNFLLNAGMVMAALIGVWGFYCLISGFVMNGICGQLRGLWIAITGI